MRISNRWNVWLIVASLCAGSVFAAGDKDGVKAELATFSPGKETKINDPDTGGLGYYCVWVPTGYTPEREWPLIICYHGKNGNPTIWPFKDLTDGQNYIILGMEYLDRESPNAEKDVANLKRIHKFVSGKLRINPKLQFMGGFSQGGWSTSSFSNLYIDQLAGLIIMGSGGSPGEKAKPVLKGKPVFIGIGEKDPANPEAKKSKDAYTNVTANVTFEEFKGLEHQVDTKNKPLKEWLLKWGPQNQMIAAMTQAKAIEKSGKLGEAYNHYIQVAKMPGGQEAGELAKLISEPAEEKLASADKALADRKYPDAVKLYVAVQSMYAGSPFAEKAKSKIDQIQTDPAIKAEIEQAKLDAKADAIEAGAQGAEKAKDYVRALTLYESYVAQFPKAAHFAAVKKHLDELKADKTIISSAKSQGADRECKGWMSTADNYLTNNMGDKAKPYLQKIIDKYGDTEWAIEAKKKIESIR